ncbi:bifunctional tRNA pseudouridine(32) synthase/23S rRNA pseudouridine(746) synthase RluA [Paraglaciecola hydrolytica]|uniref:Pseudouridine synthase n=1 Tax=Paraglaciecola hydrolytica TaxID=1799789 RepID=A0A135ZZD0_9ALTE|nr:bifunctional tRNA pseudouridine(32) synthase/23S rRNA pseudouridine(746) synthase RluA [Paraglaciecola hydrolytica]KXI28338.1 RNA pseudouridine synthase [Paraglaciecola hydrolytica]
MALLNYAPPLEPYLSILYQDNDIVVLDKPSGLLSVPGKAKEHADSLQTRVQRVFPTATVVHRLDMATSGIMVMAMNKAAHRHLSRQFELRQTQKTYQALIFGSPASNSGEIDLPLICDWPNRPKQMVDMQLGKKALTRWQLIERGEHSCRVELSPVTGRSHQLRVHMLSMGHPIIGDRLYAHPQALALGKRLHLHATTLGFSHPTTGQIQQFRSKVPF